MIIVLVLLLFISVCFYIYIETKYSKNRKIKLKSKMSGFEVARSIIDIYDLNNIYITESRTEITSKYDSNRKVIRLTKDVFNEDDIVSCSIAAFEASHAIQDKKNDKLFKIKNSIMPVANILLVVGYIILLIGCLFGHPDTIMVGLCLIDFIFLFHVVFYKTDKSSISIASVNLVNNDIISKSEYKKIEELLKVTSFRSISSTVFPVIELLKKIIAFGDSK